MIQHTDLDNDKIGSVCET